VESRIIGRAKLAAILADNNDCTSIEMTHKQIQYVVELLMAKDIVLERGLSADEIREAELKHCFQFPPDLKLFLQTALPVSSGFPNWRHDDAELKQQMSWPRDGIVFDVEENDFWLPAWGERPEELEEATMIVIDMISRAAPLIPIYKHRYLPAEPCEPGNPIISVYQTDVIRYADTLINYFENEFAENPQYPSDMEPRPIGFWDDLIDRGGVAGV